MNINKLKPFITIIIPAYNSSSFIEECIDSLSFQEHRELLQIIVINDGSLDDTLEIINKRLKLGDIDLVINQSNQGQSAARNAAFEYIQGEYVIFVDSDDMLMPGSIEIIINHLVGDNLDLLFFDANEMYDNLAPIPGKINTYNRPDCLYDNVVTGVGFFNISVGHHQYNVSPCMYASKSSICKNLRFTAGITSEDNVFTTQILLNSKALRVKAISDRLYLRRLRPDSEVTRPKTTYNYVSYVRVFDELIRFGKLNNFGKYYYVFCGNILALASRTLSEIEGTSLTKIIKYRAKLIYLSINNPRVFSARLIISLTAPFIYNKIAPFAKRLLLRRK